MIAVLDPAMFIMNFLEMIYWSKFIDTVTFA